MTREAACACGSLRAHCEGEPVRISMCHCLDCQRRTGSAFGVQARFPRTAVTLFGAPKSFKRIGDSGQSVTFHFCAECGSTLYWQLASLPDFISVAVGAFADPGFPAPWISVYEARRHGWTLDPDAVLTEHLE